MMTPTNEYVTTEECQQNAHIPKWVIVLTLTVFVGLMALFISLVNYSANRANAAVDIGSKERLETSNKIDIVLRNSTSLTTEFKVFSEIGKIEKEIMLEKLELIKSDITHLKLQVEELQAEVQLLRRNNDILLDKLTHQDKKP